MNLKEYKNKRDKRIFYYSIFSKLWCGKSATGQVDFSELRLWNQAPTNLKILSDNGIVFALTTDK
jgi:hypothetical protein